MVHSGVAAGGVGLGRTQAPAGMVGDQAFEVLAVRAGREGEPGERRAELADDHAVAHDQPDGQHRQQSGLEPRGALLGARRGEARIQDRERVLAHVGGQLRERGPDRRRAGRAAARAVVVEPAQPPEVLAAR